MRWWIVSVIILSSVIFFNSYAISSPVLSGSGSANGIGLTWNNIPTATGYHILKQTDSGLWFDLTPKNYVYTSYNDFQVSSGHVYNYKVASDQNTIESVFSNVITINTMPKPIIPDNVIVLTGQTSNQGISLTWTNANNVGFWIKEKIDDGNWFLKAQDGCCVVNGVPTGYNDYNVTTNHVYNYQVTSSGVQNPSTSNILSLDTHGVIVSPPVYPDSTLKTVSPNQAVTKEHFFGIGCGVSEGQFTLCGDPSNNLNIIFSRATNQATTLWFDENSNYGILHPHLAISEWKNGTLEIDREYQSTSGWTWRTPILIIDGESNQVQIYQPLLLKGDDGKMYHIHIPNGGGTITASQETPHVTDCTKSNCK
jgi:hypothetical protein